MSNINASKNITLKIDGADVEYVRVDSIDQPKKTGKEVIIRTFAAGVHIGEIVNKENGEVTLNNARRLWKWSGAFTLNKVATHGVDRANSRISTAVNGIVLPYIEIIPVCEGVDLSTTEK